MEASAKIEAAFSATERHVFVRDHSVTRMGDYSMQASSRELATIPRIPADLPPGISAAFSSEYDEVASCNSSKVRWTA